MGPPRLENRWILAGSVSVRGVSTPADPVALQRDRIPAAWFANDGQRPPAGGGRPLGGRAYP